ncbi:Solute carrier family 23 member 2 [Lamellibrachia satsuma]|nr:Solute carrier family 23 member 2 [Lamellibrachia satsuma]
MFINIGANPTLRIRSPAERKNIAECFDRLCYIRQFIRNRATQSDDAAAHCDWLEDFLLSAGKQTNSTTMSTMDPQAVYTNAAYDGSVEEVLNSVDGNNCITVDVPADTATNVASGETPSSRLDEVWTDCNALIFDVDDRPPFYIALAYALQQALNSITGCVVTVLVVTETICAGDNNLLVAQFLSTAVFLAGVATLMQTAVGIRLPIVQGSSFAFIPPIVAMMSTKEWQCPQHLPNVNVTYIQDGENTTSSNVDQWTGRIAELSGGLILASLVQVFIGCTGIIGTLLRFIGPLTIIPTVSLIGLSMFGAASNACESSWIVSMCGVALMCLFSLGLRKVRLPLPTWNRKEGCHTETYPVFQLFAPAFAICLCWILAHILTITNFFPDDPSHPNYKARTDSKLSTITMASWIYLPYPGQFGWPTFGAGAFVGMLAATISSIIESIGDYYATARICALPPPPKHSINRGIAIEGLASVLSGFFGVCHGTTSYSGVIGFIGVTGMAARFTWQVLGVLFIVCGLFGKVGAVLAIIPEPVIGALIIVGLGMVITVALSNIHLIDMRVPRNLMILGIAMMLGMMLPPWVKQHPGFIKTGSVEIDQVLTVLLTTAMFVGGFIGCVLDNIVPGDLESRGITAFAGHVNTDDGSAASARVSKAYGLKFLSARLSKHTYCSHVPFLPSYTGAPTLPKCRKPSANENKGHESTVDP